MLTELKFGQDALIDQLDRTLEVAHDYPRAKVQLRVLENYLLKHISLQSKSFYNTLQETNQDSPQSLKMIGFLEQNLKELKVEFLFFYDAHPGDMSDVKPGLFVRDFTEFSKNVLARLTVERDYLFPLIKEESSGV